MALFGLKKEKKVDTPKTKVTQAVFVPKKKEINPKIASEYAWVLASPRITEKAGVFASEKNIYTFNIHPDASKGAVKTAIESIYGFTPIAIRVVSIAPRAVFNRGRKGMKKGGKKAYIELAKGESIEFV